MIFQTSAAYSSATQAQYQTWGQTFGQALSSFGWVKQTGHGEVVDNGLVGSAYAWSNSPNVGTLASAPQPVQAYNFRGAWVSGNTYVGANAANSATPVDVVTNAGLTYAKITASSVSSTAPGSDPTNWQQLVFEIWKSNGPMSATFPIYLKLYLTWNTVSFTPTYWITVGTGVDVNGNITGVCNWTAAAPFYIFGWMGNNGTQAAGFNDMDFSGDADNFRFCVFKTFSAPSLFAMGRAKTSTGADSDAFVHLATAGAPSFALGLSNVRSAILLKPSLGATILVDGSRWAGIVATSNASTSNFGATPPYPIFPIVGYLANPLMGIMAFGRGDTGEGQVVPVWLYGASHNYLVLGNFGAAQSPDAISGRAYPAILWE